MKALRLFTWSSIAIVGSLVSAAHGQHNDDLHVIMPNHVNVLMTPTNGYELESVLKSIKGYSAKEINRSLGTNGTIWQRESSDHIVRDVNQLERFQKYIRANPGKANLKDEDDRLSKEAIYELA